MDESLRYTGSNISTTLRSQGRKGRWLAGRVGVSESLISKIASGDRAVKPELAEKIAEALDVPFPLLFELRERSENESVLEQIAS